MDKTMEITIKRQSGTFPLVVVVGEDGKFYKVKRTIFGNETKRYTLVAGILQDDKIALGIRYYLGDDLSRGDGQELYFGRIGGTCEVFLYHEQYSFEQDTKIEAKEISEYESDKDEVMSYDATDLYVRPYLDHIMRAAKRSFGHIV